MATIDWDAPAVRAICACVSNPAAWQLLGELIAKLPPRQRIAVRDAIWARRGEGLSQRKRARRLERLRVTQRRSAPALSKKNTTGT